MEFAAEPVPGVVEEGSDADTVGWSVNDANDADGSEGRLPTTLSIGAPRTLELRLKRSGLRVWGDVLLRAHIEERERFGATQPRRLQRPVEYRRSTLR